MDRLPEFTEIIQKFEVSEGPILRNRKSKQQQLEEERNELLDDETKNSIYNFSKSFLNECTLTVTITQKNLLDRFIIFLFRIPL